MAVFCFSHSCPTCVRVFQLFGVISLHLCFAWDCGNIPPPPTLYKPVQISNLHLSNCKEEQRGSGAQQFPCCKKIPSSGKAESSGVSNLHTSRRANSGEDLITVCYFLSSFIDYYYIVDFRVASTSLGRGPKWNESENTGTLHNGLLVKPPSHFLLNSAEREHVRKLGAKWEGNCQHRCLMCGCKQQPPPFCVTHTIKNTRICIIQEHLALE